MYAAGIFLQQLGLPNNTISKAGYILVSFGRGAVSAPRVAKQEHSHKLHDGHGCSGYIGQGGR